MLWEMISFVWLKKAPFAFIMDAKHLEYEINVSAEANLIVVVGPGRLCLVKIYIYEKQRFLLKMTWQKNQPVKKLYFTELYYGT